MKLEGPVWGLIMSCCTICKPSCCGVDAYDFSPINIAAHVTRYSTPDEGRIAELTRQLKEIKEQYRKARKITIEEMNQIFPGSQLMALLEEIETNIPIALDLIKESEARRAPRTDYSRTD